MSYPVFVRNEPPGMCCGSGKVQLEPMKPPRAPFHSLFIDEPNSSHFLKNIRLYNSCFQMASFGVSSGVVHENFMPTFRVQGQIYHLIGSLLPLPDESPKFLQIYFMGDADTQIDHRTNLFSGLRRQIVSLFQSLFDEHNDLIKSFRTNLDRMPSDSFRVVIRADQTPVGEHPGQYNAPVEDGIAIVMVQGDKAYRDISIQRRDSRLQRIDESHRFYDALQYPLIF